MSGRGCVVCPATRASSVSGTGAPGRGCLSAGRVPGLAGDVVEGLGGPLDEMEGIHALGRLRTSLGDYLHDPLRSVGEDVVDLCTTFGAGLAEEGDRRLAVPIGCGRTSQPVSWRLRSAPCLAHGTCATTTPWSGQGTRGASASSIVIAAPSFRLRTGDDPASRHSQEIGDDTTHAALLVPCTWFLFLGSSGT